MTHPPSNSPKPEDKPFDCLSCGACCRTGHDGRILVSAEDLVFWRRAGREDIARQIQPGHFGMEAYATREDGSCVHLGAEGQANACQIYSLRGETCRDFEAKSPQCLEFRRRFGID